MMSDSNEKILSVGKNANDTAALVWSVADDLVGAYKPHEYGLVILPPLTPMGSPGPSMKTALRL